MVKHIVLWRFKADGDTNNKLRKMQKLKIMIEALRENIEGILELEVGIDINNPESSADMALYSVFESRQALDFYQTHPEHQKVASELKEITLERRVADYEI